MVELSIVTKVLRYVTNILVTKEFIGDVKDELETIKINMEYMKVTKAQEPNSEKLWTFSFKSRVLFCEYYVGSESYID
jgi:hypothetical protein